MHKHSLRVGLTALRALDLSQVRRKLQEPAPEGKGWDDKTAEEAEMWYRRFLEVCLRHPEFPVVPNFTIDAFWHQHILDTRAYARDCDAVFGAFVHHYPYFGLNGDADKRDAAFGETNELYRTLFGEDCTGMQPAGCETGGATCASNAQAKDCNMSACRADDPRAPDEPMFAQASGCNHSGSGTGCGQGGRGRRSIGVLDLMGDGVGCHAQHIHEAGRPDFERI